MNKPKFQIGDPSFFMENNKPVSKPITGVISIKNQFYYTTLRCLDVNSWEWIAESDLFANKQELIDSL